MKTMRVLLLAAVATLLLGGLRRLAVLSALILVGAVAFSAPASASTIVAVSPSSATQSGRIVIGGSGFGSLQGAGHVDVAGIRAPTTRWTDAEIVAYVPEAAPLGTVPVTVTTDAGGSASATLSVTARPPADGHVLWRFQVDAPYVNGRLAVGADGTVYAWDVLGHLYALAPDGGLKWIYNGPAGGAGQVSVGDDGTIYVAGGWTLDAVNPNGTFKWRYVAVDSQGIIAGPNVGPDGNVYAIFDALGPGAVSLTPAGQVRWTNQGNPRFSEYGQTGQNIAFSSGRLYASFDEFGIGPATLYGLTLTGQQVVGVTLNVEGNTDIAVGADGTLYSPEYLILRALDPNGNTLWLSPLATSDVSSPAVGGDGTVYAVEDMWRLRAYTPAGSLKWTFTPGTLLDRPTVSPANDIVLMGGRITYGERGLVQAVDTAGRALWQQIFPLEDGGFCPVPNTAPTFRPDSTVAYLGADRLCLANPVFSYVYAVQTSGTAAPPPPPPPSAVDTVSVTKASYSVSKRQLRIDATGSDPSATLTAYVTATNDLIGVLTTTGPGSYHGQFSWPQNPQQITVRSSLGGSTTAAVRSVR